MQTFLCIIFDFEKNVSQDERLGPAMVQPPLRASHPNAIQDQEKSGLELLTACIGMDTRNEKFNNFEFF